MVTLKRLTAANIRVQTAETALSELQAEMDTQQELQAGVVDELRQKLKNVQTQLAAKTPDTAKRRGGLPTEADSAANKIQRLDDGASLETLALGTLKAAHVEVIKSKEALIANLMLQQQQSTSQLQQLQQQLQQLQQQQQRQQLECPTPPSRPSDVDNAQELANMQFVLQKRMLMKQLGTMN